MAGFLNPEKVLTQLNLEKYMIAVDFGSGDGGWAIPLAKELECGMVYAVDVLEEPLSSLRSKAKMEKILNIQTVLNDVEKGVNLPPESADIVLMTNLLFQVDDKKKVLGEGKRVLKEKGNILIVDWKPNSPLGPKGGRVSPESVKELASGIGLELKKEFDAGSYHYGLIFTRL